METIEKQNQKRQQEGEEKSLPAKSLLRFIKDLGSSLSRFFCYVALKLKLKEIGSSIRCDGKLSVLGTKNIKIGTSCHFGKNVRLRTEGRGYIHIGENVKIEGRVTITSTCNITIEDNSFLGEEVVIEDRYTASETEVSHTEGKSVYIGKNVWVGKGTQIHAGVTIGHGSTISANSVVLRSIPPRVIAGGSPARVVKENGV